MHVKVVKSAYPEMEKENTVTQIKNEDTQPLSRQEAMDKCAEQAKTDAEYILYLKKMKKQLNDNFLEYVKERLKIERESARNLVNLNTAKITSHKDIEVRLCYIEQFIDIVRFGI